MEKRLQSFKLPRDLTLGGTKPKKKFAPNLNVARNKEKSKEFLIKTEDKKKFNNKREHKNNKLFDRADRYVQSSGIFSDGMATDALRKARYERIYSARDDTPNSMPIPKIKKDEWQVDTKNENKVYENITGCDDDIIDEEEKLPFALQSWNDANLKENKVPIKPEVKVETNPTNILDLNRLKIEVKTLPSAFQKSERYSDHNPALMLWSMPDSFAGKGLSDDPDVKTVFDYKLSEMLEGEIGKLRIHKSGKMEVCMGCSSYMLEPSYLDIFSEKIVQINVKESGESTSAVLGEVQNRFILNPNWTNLLGDS